MSEQQQTKRIRGVFSSQEVRKVGTGTTTRKTVSKIFWFVEQADDGNIFIQSLNTNYVPIGLPKTITMEELLSKYSPEPEFYIQSVFPKMQQLAESLNKGDESRAKGETFTAEFEYENALKLDEDNVRANFGIGLTYLSRGEAEKADNIFERLVQLDAAFEEQHKHLFNEFGINLRKNKMYDQAVEYYIRALELTTADENLHINMARAYLEKKNYEACIEQLFEALKLSPENTTVIQFLTWLDNKKFVPQNQQKQVTAVIQASTSKNSSTTNKPSEKTES